MPASRLKSILLFSGLIFLVIVFSLPPLISHLIKRQLSRLFTQSQIKVEVCIFRPLEGLSISGVRISRGNDYDISVKEVLVGYGRNLIIRDAQIVSKNPDKKIGDFTADFNFRKSGPAFFKSVEISGMSVDIKSSDLIFKAVLSAGLDLAGPKLNYLEYAMDNLEFSGVRAGKVSLRIDPRNPQGEFSVAELKYDKLKVSDIKGKVKIDKTGLSIFDLSARTLDSYLEAELELNFTQGAQYRIALKCRDLNIESLVRDFNWQDKFRMTGRVGGELRLRGKGNRIEILNGGFSTLSPGGTLVITDSKFLENMARSSGQAVDLLVESFKNYSYNNGVISLGIEDNNVILKVRLDGQAGARDLSVVIHDFKL